MFSNTALCVQSLLDINRGAGRGSQQRQHLRLLDAPASAAGIHHPAWMEHREQGTGILCQQRSPPPWSMCKDCPTSSRLPVQKHLLKWHPSEKINLQVSVLLQQSHRLTWALWGSWQRVQRLQSAKTAKRMSGKHTRGKADIANSCEVTSIRLNLWQPPTKDSWSLRIPARDSKLHWGSAFEGALSCLLPPDLQGLNSTLHHPPKPRTSLWFLRFPQPPDAYSSSIFQREQIC